MRQTTVVSSAHFTMMLDSCEATQSYSSEFRTHPPVLTPVLRVKEEEVMLSSLTT